MKVLASYASEVRRRHRKVKYLTFRLCLFVLMEFDNLASQYAAVLGFIRSAFQFIVTIPDPLRIKPSAIQPHQAALYEYFGKAFRRIATSGLPI
jgi:hypothetical protein